MKIVLASPLYPPDIAEPAPYVKELARRLSRDHKVTIVTYGKIPETVAGVEIICIRKQSPLPLRIISFTFALLRQVMKADILFAENGASVELPVGIVSLLTGKPMVTHIGDPLAQKYAHKHGTHRVLERFAQLRAKEVSSKNPLPRPEILPFKPHPTHELSNYEQSWKNHMQHIEKLLSHGI